MLYCVNWMERLFQFNIVYVGMVFDIVLDYFQYKTSFDIEVDSIH